MRKNIRIINLIIILISLITLAFVGVLKQSNAQEEIYFPEPKNMEYAISYKTVDRAKILEKFFEQYNSPLVKNVNTFVRVADKYNIDYRILPAISCMESTCGKVLIEGTYNPFGWGVYGNQHIAFESYDEAIETVGRGLNKNYFSKGYNTLAKIAPIYTPPNSHNWYSGTMFFKNKINEVAKTI